MTWELSVFRGDEDGLEDEERLPPLDGDRAREVIRAAFDGVDEQGGQIMISRRGTLTDIQFIDGADGALRAVESEIYPMDARPEALRSAVRELLELSFRLAEELDARVFDHESWTFVARADLETLVERNLPTEEP